MLKRTVLFSLSIVLILLALLPFASKLSNVKDEKHKEEAVEEFLNSVENVGVERVVKSEKYDYVAVLEIPFISLKRGLVSMDNKYNDIKYNIEILEGSSMPDVVGSNLILASHSGSSSISFFKKLDQLNREDDIYIDYDGKRYHYIVVNIYEEKKDGDIAVYKSADETILTLTTCSQKNKGYQLVVISQLKEIFD